MPDPRDLELRQTAFEHVRGLSRRYDDIIPVDELRKGFAFRGERVSLGSFYSGIFRPRQMEGPAALCLVTAPPKSSGRAPYEDGFDERTNGFVYHYRSAKTDTAQARLTAGADNRTLRAAFELGVPVLYFHGVAPGQYTPVCPMFVLTDDPDRRVVSLQAAMPIPTSPRPACSRARTSAATRPARPGCACTVMGIDPTGVVHIATRLLHEIDGPMLRVGLQGFHGEAMRQPRSRVQRPDPDRLEARYEQFKASA